MCPQWSAVVGTNHHSEKNSHHSDRIATTTNSLTSTKNNINMNENVQSQLPAGLHNTYVCAYIHSVYKESPRHYLSIEIKNHKF